MPIIDEENISKRKEDYYTRGGSKVGDFCWGFFSALVVMMIIGALIYLLSYLQLSNPNGSNLGIIFNLLTYLAQPILLAAAVLSIVMSFKKGRRFIGIGIIVACCIPIVLILLLFGACLLSASSW